MRASHVSTHPDWRRSSRCRPAVASWTATAGGAIAARRGEEELRHPFAAWLVRQTPAPVRGPVELVVRTVVDALEDRVVGLSAEVAFFAILSLPPLLLTVVAALGYLPGDQSDAFVTGVAAASERVFTRDTVDELIRPFLEDIVAAERIGLLSGAFAVAIFSASRAVRVVLTSVTIAYDLEARRPSWAQRLYGFAATLGLLVTVPVIFPLLLAGPDLGRDLAAYSWVPAQAADVWPYVYWLGVGLGAVLAVAGLYHLAAPWWTPFRRDLPGAALAVGVWLASSAGLRTYAEQAFIGREVFQVIAGPLVLLVWLYTLAFGVILGAELNAELERIWPSPEQQRAPRSERLRRRVLESSAGTAAKERIEQTLPGIVQGVRARREAEQGDRDANGR